MRSRLFVAVGKWWGPALDSVLTVSLICLTATLIWLLVRTGVTPIQRAAARPAPSKAAKPLPPLPADAVSIDGALLKGSKDAKMVVIEYSDVQCPYFLTFVRDTLPEFEMLHVPHT